jgi:predicted nucleic acid-binding protein
MKTIVDTSAWIEYFKGGAGRLDQLLSDSDVLIHPVVIGELSCGSLKSRNKTLGDLKLLPRVDEAEFDEVISLIEDRRLYGKGLGFGDAQLLASALISGAPILSFDKALNQAAKSLGVGA